MENSLREAWILSKHLSSPIEKPCGHPFLYLQSRSGEGNVLPSNGLEVTVNLNSGFVSVMFYLNLPFGLVHYITNQGDYFNAITLPSAAQVWVVCGHSRDFAPSPNPSLVERTVIHNSIFFRESQHGRAESLLDGLSGDRCFDSLLSSARGMTAAHSSFLGFSFHSLKRSFEPQSL